MAETRFQHKHKHTHTPHEHRHTHNTETHTHSHTPLTPDTTFLLVFSRPIFPLILYPPFPPSPLPRTSHTDLSHRNAHWGVLKPLLDQMRTGKRVCSCWQCVCLIYCRGGNCESRTCRRNLNRAPIDWKSLCRGVCLVLSVSFPVAVSVFFLSASVMNCVCFLFDVSVLSIGVTWIISLV